MIKRIGKGFLFVVTSPVLLIKVILKWLVNMFKGLQSSIRKKITFDFLFLYLIVSIFSIVIVSVLYLFFQVGQTSDHLNAELNRYYLSYENDFFTEEALNEKINNVSQIYNTSLEVIIQKDGVEVIKPIKTGELVTLTYPSSIYKSWEMFIKYRNIRDGEISYKIAGQTTKGYEYITRIMYPFSEFSYGFFVLLAFMLFGQGMGFFFISLIGGNQVKKVLNPIYKMTKTAEKISINNMNQRLDVSKTKYELKDLALTLNAMLDRLDSDYEKQKRFVSDVSHELRTPISIINGYANMLERWGKKDQEILEESIDAIIDEAKSMQELVENLLTLVRSDNQTLKFQMETFDLSHMIADVVKESRMVNQKNQKIEYQVPETLDVSFDIHKIKQTLRIFVDNATKYTHDNGKVMIRAYERDKVCFIHIKDNGIGIDKQDLPRLFDRFYRSDESRTRQTGGHGLGLAIAKAIVIGHKGRIRVKSKFGEGSEFIIEIPMS